MWGKKAGHAGGVAPEPSLAIAVVLSAFDEPAVKLDVAGLHWKECPKRKTSGSSHASP